jgi:hypothetical protein
MTSSRRRAKRVLLPTDARDVVLAASHRSWRAAQTGGTKPSANIHARATGQNDEHGGVEEMCVQGVIVASGCDLLRSMRTNMNPNAQSND